MFVLALVSGALLALVLGSAALGVARRDPKAMDLLSTIRAEPLSGVVVLVDVAAASGVIAGLAWAPIGVLAGLGTIVYMGVAVVMHLRAGDRNLTAALVVIALASAYVLGRGASG